MHFFEHAMEVSLVNQEQGVFICQRSHADNFYTHSALQFCYPLGKNPTCWKTGFSAKESFSSRLLACQGFRFLLLDLCKDYGTKWDLQKH